MTFKVVVDYETLEVSTGGSVVGRLHVHGGGEPFPDLVWWDFPCVVLGWWVDALQERRGSFELRFMDGPAVIGVVVDDNDVAAITAKFESPTSDKVSWSAAVPFGAFRSEVHRAAESLAHACESRGLPADGLERRFPGK